MEPFCSCGARSDDGHKPSCDPGVRRAYAERMRRRGERAVTRRFEQAIVVPGTRECPGFVTITFV